MKHLHTFTEFLNENTLLEKKELSPMNVRQYEWNKKSVDALKKWTYKLKGFEAKFNDWEYHGIDSTFASFLKDRNSYGINYLSLNIGGAIIKVSINQRSNSLEFKIEPTYNSMSFNIKELQYIQYIEENTDKIEGFINLLNFLFDTYKKQIEEFVDSKLSLKTLYVIDAGGIAPQTGKTGHGWSIYDSPDVMLGMVKGGIMALWGANGFKVGDKFKIVNDQNHSVISNEVEIVALVPAKYNDFVAYSRQRGAEIPVKSFQKQLGSFRFRLYSIK